MIQFELTSTPLAEPPKRELVPDDCELFAILLALLSIERCSIRQLRSRVLALNEDNLEAVAHVVATRFPLLFQRAEGEAAIRASLTRHVTSRDPLGLGRTPLMSLGEARLQGLLYAND